MTLPTQPLRASDGPVARACDLVRAALPNCTGAPNSPELRVDCAGDGVTVTGTDGETFVSVRVPGSGHHSDVPPARVPAAPLVGGPRKTVGREQFAAALRSVMPAASTDPSHTSINGVRVRVKGLTLTLAATDGARYATVDIPALPTDLPSERRLDLLVAPETLAATVPQFSAPTVGIGWQEDRHGSWHSLQCGDVTIITKRNASAFPRHERLLRLSRRARVVVERDALVAVASTAPDVASLTVTFGGLSLDGHVLTAATWGVTYQDDLQVVPRFLVDAVTQLQSTMVALHFVDPTDPTRPIVITAADDQPDDPRALRHVLLQGSAVSTPEVIHESTYL